MMKFWMQLKPRERNLVSIMGGVIVVLMLYVLLLEPFLGKAEELTEKIAQQKTQIESMKQTLADIKQLERTADNSTSNNRKGQSLLVIVDQTAKENKLGDSMKRVEPDGSTRVRVWLEMAIFDDVARWLSRLQTQYSLEIESAVLDKTDTTGRVNARLVFTEGAA